MNDGAQPQSRAVACIVETVSESKNLVLLKVKVRGWGSDMNYKDKGRGWAALWWVRQRFVLLKVKGRVWQRFCG